MLVATAQQMRQADHRAMKEFFLPGLLLMENAAQGAAAVARALLNKDSGRSLAGVKILALCGMGNNGGDACACARILANQGALAHVVLMGQAEKLSGDALSNWQMAKACGLRLREKPKSANDLLPLLEEAHIIVDGLLGTGFKPPLRPEYAEVIELVNKFAGVTPIVAMDIPSGQDADSGAGETVLKASASATFACLKLGMALNPYPAGQIHVVDIGMPPGALTHIGGQVRLMERHMAAGLLPARGASAHKGSFGHVFLLGGSSGKSGAMVLAAQGAQASGAGLITAALPHGLLAALEARLAAPMSLGLPENSQQSLSMSGLAALLEAPASSWVVGPGLGQDEEARALACAFLNKNTLPVVVDADALNALAPLAGKPIAAGQALLTPHPGEAARLLNLSVGQVQKNRLLAAQEIARQSGAVCLLKGAASVLAHPDGRALINHTGNNLLASGGSGDVLAGLAGGLLAQGLSAWEAGALAAYAHGLAADLAAAEGITRGWPMEELAGYIVKAWGNLEA